MTVRRILLKIVVGVLLAGLVAGCSQPPPPSAETAVLEGSLLTIADVGGGFVVESRGQVGVSGGGICPESEFGFEDVGVVRASFVWPMGGDEVGLVEMLRFVGSGELDTLFSELRVAYQACYGVVWTDYGDTQTIDTAAQGLQAFEEFEYDYYALDSVELRVYYDESAHRLVEKPAGLFAYAWFELLAEIDRLLPLHCEHCGLPFLPNRDGQRYCPGTGCYEAAYQSQYARHPHRREYQRMYKRYRRGTITEQEWQRWREENPEPRHHKEGT